MNGKIVLAFLVVMAFATLVLIPTAEAVPCSNDCSGGSCKLCSREAVVEEPEQDVDGRARHPFEEEED